MERSSLISAVNAVKLGESNDRLPGGRYRDDRRHPLHRRLASRIDGRGLAISGAFHPESDDQVPALADGRLTGTVVLLGWTGGQQWPVFAGSREANEGLPDPLNRWSKRLAYLINEVLHAAGIRRI